MRHPTLDVEKFDVQPSHHPPGDVWPWAPHRCPRCCRLDTIPMPAEHLVDHAISCIGFSPFKCRACRAKFYRRSSTIPERPNPTPPAPSSEPTPTVAVCHRDPAKTLQRVEQIILIAESTRFRRG
jgi:hypothetical protein